MTAEQEANINNALLTLMYEWKTGMTDQQQALKEFKQCLKYYSRMEDVVVFQQDELVDEQRIDCFGIEKTIEYVKREMAEKLAKEIIAKGCVSFEELELVRPSEYPPLNARHFRMKAEAIIQTNKK